MNNPTVSVVLPVYNGENYLRQAIESVLTQTLSDLELIVVDDGSMDLTPAIARSYGESVTYVRQENTGVAGAFNHGLRLAKGRFISWLSHDDAFLPQKLEKQFHVLSQATAPAVCYTDIELIDANGLLIVDLKLPEYDRDYVLRHLLTAGPIGLAAYSVMYDRRCIETVGAYSEYWRHTQDAEMLMRLARQFPLIRVPESLIRVREHDSRGIRSKQWQQEVVRYFETQLSAVPLDELFPELKAGAGRADRCRVLEWLGDELTKRPFPIYRVAFSQYRRALRENPARVPQLLRKSQWLFRKYIREDFRRNQPPDKLPVQKLEDRSTA